MEGVQQRRAFSSNGKRAKLQTREELFLRAQARIPQLGHRSCSLNAQMEPQAEAVISTTTPRGEETKALASKVH